MLYSICRGFDIDSVINAVNSLAKLEVLASVKLFFSYQARKLTMCFRHLLGHLVVHQNLTSLSAAALGVFQSSERVCFDTWIMSSLKGYRAWGRYRIFCNKFQVGKGSRSKKCGGAGRGEQQLWMPGRWHGSGDQAVGHTCAAEDSASEANPSYGLV